MFNAGQVKRWHTRGHVIRQQDVSQHSFGVIMIIVMLHPDPSANLLKAAVCHDTGEIAAGDLPYWIKKHNPEVAAEIERLECENRTKFGAEFHDLLSRDELHWLRAADVLDAWLFSLQNVLCHNHYMQGALNKLTTQIRDDHRKGTCPTEVIVAMEQILSVYPWVKTW